MRSSVARLAWLWRLARCWGGAWCSLLSSVRVAVARRVVLRPRGMRGRSCVLVAPPFQREGEANQGPDEDWGVKLQGAEGSSNPDFPPCPF
jgi:hypothetical protein